MSLFIPNIYEQLVSAHYSISHSCEPGLDRPYREKLLAQHPEDGNQLMNTLIHQDEPNIDVLFLKQISKFLAIPRWIKFWAEIGTHYYYYVSAWIYASWTSRMSKTSFW